MADLSDCVEAIVVPLLLGLMDASGNLGCNSEPKSWSCYVPRPVRIVKKQRRRSVLKWRAYGAAANQTSQIVEGFCRSQR